MSKRAADGAEENDFDSLVQESAKRTRRAPNLSLKNGEPIFSLPTTNHISNHNINFSSVHNMIGSNNMMNNGYSMDMSNMPTGLNPSLTSMSMSMNHSNLPLSLMNMPGNTQNSLINPIGNDKDDDDNTKPTEELSQADYAIIGNIQLLEKLNNIVYEEDQVKHGVELTKVDIRNNYFFNVMTTIIDFMVEHKHPCKQITRLYTICGHYIQSTARFPDIKMKTISNEYSCANSWTNKVQNIIALSDFENDTIIIPKDTIESFPKPFEKYFEIDDVTETAKVKLCYIDVYKTFVRIREKMKQLKENAGMNVNNNKNKNDGGRMNSSVKQKKSKKNEMYNHNMVSSHLQPNGNYSSHFFPNGMVPPVNGFNHFNNGSIKDSALANFYFRNDANIDHIVNHNFSSSSIANLPPMSSTNHARAEAIIQLLPPNYNGTPTLSYPFPVHYTSDSIEYQPFLSYIPCMLFPVHVTNEEMNYIHNHLQQASQMDSSDPHKHKKDIMGNSMVPDSLPSFEPITSLTSNPSNNNGLSGDLNGGMSLNSSSNSSSSPIPIGSSISPSHLPLTSSHSGSSPNSSNSSNLTSNGSLSGVNNPINLNPVNLTNLHSHSHHSIPHPHSHIPHSQHLSPHQHHQHHMSHQHLQPSLPNISGLPSIPNTNSNSSYHNLQHIPPTSGALPNMNNNMSSFSNLKNHITVTPFNAHDYASSNNSHSIVPNLPPRH